MSAESDPDLSAAEAAFVSGDWWTAFNAHANACRNAEKRMRAADFTDNQDARRTQELAALASLAEMEFLFRQDPRPDMEKTVSGLYAGLDNTPSLRRAAGLLLADIAERNGSLRILERVRYDLGRITDWQFLGPVHADTEDVDARPRLDAPVDLNRRLALEASVLTRGRTVRWRRLPAVTPSGRIPLHQLVKAETGIRILLATWVQSPVPQTITLILETAGPVRLYLNRDPAGRFNGVLSRPLEPVRLRLRIGAGWNRILVESKCVDPAAWSFACRVEGLAKDLVWDASKARVLAATPKPPNRLEVIEWPAWPKLPSKDAAAEWTNADRDRVIAWARAARRLCDRSPAARPAVVRLTALESHFKNDPRLAVCLLQMTPDGEAGFGFPRPPLYWVKFLEDQKAWSRLAVWFRDEPKLNPESAVNPVHRHPATTMIPMDFTARWMRQARYEAQRGDWPAAARALRTVRTVLQAKKQPLPADVWWLDALYANRLGRPQQSLEHVLKSLSGRMQMDAMRHLSDVYLRLHFGRESYRAVPFLARMAELHPLHADIRLLLARHAQAREDWPAAVRWIREVTVRRPDDAGAWQLRAQLEQEAGDSGQAQSSRVQWRALQPEFVRPVSFPRRKLDAEGISAWLKAVDQNRLVEAAPGEDQPADSAVPDLRTAEHVILSQHRHDEWLADGRLVRREHRVVYVRSHRAAKQHQQMQIAADSSCDRQGIRGRRIRIRSGADVIHMLEGVSAFRKGAFHLWIEDLQVGDLYEILDEREYSAGHFHSQHYAVAFDFRHRDPVVEQSFQLTYPADRKILWQPTGVPVPFQTRELADGKRLELTWWRRWNVERLMAPNQLRIIAYRAENWYLQWARVRLQSDPSFQAMLANQVSQLRSARAVVLSDRLLARELFDRVRNRVDRLPAPDGFGNLPMQDSRQTWSLRKGTALDQCRLLADMLQAAGLNAGVWLVRTKGEEMPDPMTQKPVLPGDFGRVLVGWHRPFEPMMWLDPDAEDPVFSTMPPSRMQGLPALHLTSRGPVISILLPREELPGPEVDVP